MIGKLDRRVTIIQAITETGESNEKKITGWERIEVQPKIWAQKIERSGNTAVVNDRITLTQQTDWVIRFRTDLLVSPSMRLVYETQMYEIINIQEVTADQRGVKNAPRKRYSRIVTNVIDNETFT